jgi:hypothetical protein
MEAAKAQKHSLKEYGADPASFLSVKTIKLAENIYYCLDPMTHTWKRHLWNTETKAWE